MNLWPSRGLSINGFEFKVSRSDWVRELKTPEKAEPIAQYCDYWWVVTDSGIVKEGELPKAWGLMEVHNGTLKVIKNAPIKDSVPVTRKFMASIFRRMSEMNSAEIEQIAAIRVAELDDERNRSFKALVRQETMKYKELRKIVDEFKESSGVDLAEWGVYPKEVGKAVDFVLKNRVFGAYNSIERLCKSMSDSADEIRKSLEARQMQGE